MSLILTVSLRTKHNMSVSLLTTKKENIFRSVWDRVRREWEIASEEQEEKEEMEEPVEGVKEEMEDGTAMDIASN